MSFPGDLSYHSDPPVRYIFRENAQSRLLLIIFSAFAEKGSAPRYNYLNTLENVAVNQLFILDDCGSEGCYYLGENRDFFVESNVIRLIHSVADQNGIQPCDMIAAGTSKGGYAALYYGFRYGFGTVISGGFQSLLGDYLMEYHPDTARFIAGGSSQQDRTYLNHLLFDAARSVCIAPKLYLHMGTGDYHYAQHMIPLLRFLDEQGIPYQLDLADYTEHDEVGMYFPHYLESCLKRII